VLRNQPEFYLDGIAGDVVGEVEAADRRSVTRQLAGYPWVGYTSPLLA
jgi:hypothetical protein